MRRVKLVTAIALSAVLVAGALPVVSSQGQSSGIILGKVKKNKKKGTAKLTIRNIPGAGTIVCKGKKIKRRSKSTFGAGSTKVRIKPKRRVKRKLTRRARVDGVGTVRVKARCTFTPRPGAYSPGSSADSKRFKLKKKLRR